MFCCSTGQVIPCCPLVKLYFSFIFSFTLKAWQGERLLGCFPQGIDLEECKDCARAASTFCSAADVWREPAHLYAAEWEWWVCILALSNLLKKKKKDLTSCWTNVSVWVVLLKTESKRVVLLSFLKTLLVLGNLPYVT